MNKNNSLILLLTIYIVVVTTSSGFILLTQKSGGNYDRELSRTSPMYSLLDWSDLPVLESSVMPSLSKHLFYDDHFFPGVTDTFPRSMRVDVQEKPKEYLIYVDVFPGLSKDELKLTIEDHVLKISFERKIEDTDKFIRKERFYGTMSRAFELPEDTDEDQVSAQYKSGVLQVSIPRLTEKSKPKVKEIKITDMVDEKEQQTLASTSDDGLTITESGSQEL